MRNFDTTIYDLPTTPEDLVNFMLVAPGRLKDVEAEIRVIERLDTAKGVLDQKNAERARLQELILRACQRLGEITRRMPKGSANQYTLSAGGRLVKTKAQALKELGLSTSCVGRMEKIAAHPEIVDQVIAESKAEETEATQAEVLRRIDDLKHPCKEDEPDQGEADPDEKNLKLFRQVTNYKKLRKITDAVLDSVVAHDEKLKETLDRLMVLSYQYMEIYKRLKDKADVAERHRLMIIALQEVQEQTEFAEPEFDLADLELTEMAFVT